jgi:hypothetical protein
MTKRLFLGRIGAVNCVLEFKFNGLLQEFHEAAFLFGHSGLDGLAFVTAEGTEKERQTSFTAEDVNTFAAHDFAAVCAFVGGGSARMAGTNHSATGLNDWRLWAGPFKLRNRDMGFGGFDEKIDVAQGHSLAGKQARFGDRIAIQKGAVGGLAIPDEDAIGGEDKFAMDGRDGGMIDREIAVRGATYPVDARPQFQCLAFQPFGFDQKFRHVILRPL